MDIHCTATWVGHLTPWMQPLPFARPTEVRTKQQTMEHTFKNDYVVVSQCGLLWQPDDSVFTSQAAYHLKSICGACPNVYEFPFNNVQLV